ncbi:DNA translocase FtsK 4TM domain-containing protein [bacterium]|nr:DNA translocase FtsK 4TM domain-containing protein [bacterium]
MSAPTVEAKSRGREVAGVVFAAIALLLALALASYAPDDPSWLVAAPGRPQNWIGPVGAQIAAFFVGVFGLAAWFFPPALGFLAWGRFRNPSNARKRGGLLGWILVALACTLLLALVARQIEYRDAPHPAGGVLGVVLARTLTSALSEVGALVVAGALLVAGVVLAARALSDRRPATATGIVRRGARPAPPQPERPAKPRRGLLRFLWPFGRRKRPARPARPAAPAAEEPRRAAKRQPPAADDSSGRLMRGRGVRPGEQAFDDDEDELLDDVEQLFSSAHGGRDRWDEPVEPLPPDIDPPLDAEFDEPSAEFPSGPVSAPVSAPAPRIEPPRRRPVPAPAPASIEDAFGGDEDDEDDAAAAPFAEEEDAPRPVAPAPTAPPRAARKRAVKPAPKPKQPRLPVELPTAQAKLPPVELLAPAPARVPPDKQELAALARHIEERCAEFHVDGHVMAIHPGPVVTTFEFRPNAGIKLQRITALADDLALGLEAESVRLDRIPGRSAVGIEVPNRRRETIALREVLESDHFRRGGDMLTVGLGKSQEGEICCASLAKMPHLLVAGATGSGKSVGLNCIITSILYNARPDEVKFILIDPKMLELGLYEGIPHLLVPVVTDMKQAGNALKWAVREMDRRYRLLAACNVRHLDAFNKLVAASPSTVAKAIQTIPARAESESYEAAHLPYVVIVVDELADMLMTTGQEVEEAIARLAQKARAVGIHLVLATQRPSVDVLTGSIKANFPARIGFRVASKIDSRTILDASGAERLLGAGDMLYRQPGSARLQRVHGAFVSEDENLRVVQWLKAQGKADYDKSILEDPPEEAGAEGADGDVDMTNDPMYRKAVRLVVSTGQASTSFLQRRMRLGYSRAARIIDQMEREGIIGPADGSRPRQVLVESEFLERMDQQDDEG